MQHIHTLPGGLRLVIEPLPHVHSVAIGAFVAAGSAHEQRTTAGMAHMIEHMLFKGTERYPTPRALADAIEGRGGILDAYTEFDTTVYYAKITHDHAGLAADLLADLLIRPNLTAADIEKERRVIAEELRETEDSPADLVYTVLDAAMWGDQPLGRDIAGDQESVAGLTHAQLREHWAHHYTTGNTVISVAGRITPEAAIDLIGTALRDMPVGPLVQAPASLPANPGPRVHHTPDRNEQANFALALPGLAYTDPDRRALRVLDTILGGGMASRLFQRIREDLGLAYSVGSFCYEHHDAGKWGVYGSVEPARLRECVDEVLRELQTVREQGVSAAELQRVKDQTRGGMLLDLEDTWSVAGRNGAQLRRYGRVIPVADVIAEVDALTLGDIARVAQHILRDDALHLAVIGPRKYSVDEHSFTIESYSQRAATRPVGRRRAAVARG